MEGVGGAWREVGGAWREEGVGEVGVATVSRDWLVEVDDSNAIDREGALARVDDAVEDGFDIVGIRGLVVGCRRFDSEAYYNEAPGYVGAGPDPAFGEAESLSVGVGGGVVRHVDESRRVGGRDLEGGGYGVGGEDEVALR